METGFGLKSKLSQAKRTVRAESQGWGSCDQWGPQISGLGKRVNIFNKDDKCSGRAT